MSDWAQRLVNLAGLRGQGNHCARARGTSETPAQPVFSENRQSCALDGEAGSGCVPPEGPRCPQTEVHMPGSEALVS